MNISESLRFEIEDFFALSIQSTRFSTLRISSLSLYNAPRCQAGPINKPLEGYIVKSASTILNCFLYTFSDVPLSSTLRPACPSRKLMNLPLTQFCAQFSFHDLINMRPEEYRLNSLPITRNFTFRPGQNGKIISVLSSSVIMF